MSQDIKNVIVVGASGNLGPSVVQALLDSGKFTVSVLTRTTTSASFPSKVSVHKTDYTEASLLQALKGQDAVVSTIAGAGIEEQKKIIDAAVKAGVKRFMPSEYGSNTSHPKGMELVPIFKRKVAIIEHLKQKAAASTSFSWTALVTGPFFDRSFKNGILGFDIPARKATIYDSGTRLFSTTTRHTVAQAIVTILSSSTGKNQYLYIASFTVSQNDILAAVQKVMGGKEWTTTKISAVTKVESDRKTVTKGHSRKESSAAIRPLITAATYAEGSGSNFEKEVPSGLSNSALGLPKESLETVIKAVLDGTMG